MAEYPIILAHNVLDGALVTGNAATGRELERLRDGHRHTWWEAPSTEQQDISIVCRNLMENPDFELNLDGWIEYVNGDGAGSMSRNTTDPIGGVADLEAVVTTASETTDVYLITARRAVFMRAGRTYRVMCKANADANNKVVRIGFLDEDYSENASNRSEFNVGTSIIGLYHDLTPTVDGWHRPYVRICTAGTIRLDDFHCNEVRDVDTLIIDVGHTLAYSYIQIKYTTDGVIWSTANYGFHQNEGPVFRRFDAKRALAWELNISIADYMGEIPPARIPLLYLGERWTLPRNFAGSFDPHERARFDDDSVGERGILQRVRKYDQRVFRAAINQLTPTDYERVRKFFEDSDNGARPFFLAWKPDSEPTDIPAMRLRGWRNVPFVNGARRSWNFDAEEVVGRRIL